VELHFGNARTPRPRMAPSPFSVDYGGTRRGPPPGCERASSLMEIGDKRAEEKSVAAAPQRPGSCDGGGKGIRTPDLLHAIRLGRDGGTVPKSPFFSSKIPILTPRDPVFSPFAAAPQTRVFRPKMRTPTRSFRDYGEPRSRKKRLQIGHLFRCQLKMRCESFRIGPFQ